MKITEEEVQKILDLVDKSSFGELYLQSGGLHLTLIKGAATNSVEIRSVAAAAPAAPTQPQAQAQQPLQPQQAPAGPAAAEGMSVKSPMIGTFYSKPEPGAPPFVEPGSLVDEDTTVCLIETMKVFTSVKAGVRGRIAEVCVTDTQMVEYGQVLFTLGPE